MKRLLVYYGWPSLINGRPGGIIEAARILNQHHYIILGAGLEDPAHPDHGQTAAILPLLDSLVFGYVDLGMSTSMLPMPEIDRRVRAWQRTGASGIFYDDAGRDFGVTPARLSAAVWFARDRGMPVCVNCWNPEDLYGAAMPPAYYLAESWVVRGSHPDWGWRIRGRRIRRVQRLTGVEVLSVGTGRWSRRRMVRALSGAERFGHAGFGWGGVNYHTDSRLPDYWEGL